MIEKQILRKSKRAFSMMTAIFVIVMMATLSAMILNVTGKTIKATTQQYQKEQAVLLARSYTELAILYATNYERTPTAHCLEDIKSHFGQEYPNGYDIVTKIQYIGKNTALLFCTNNIALFAGDNGFDNTISMIVDTYVTYRDFDDPVEDRNITFHKRTLQKL